MTPSFQNCASFAALLALGHLVCIAAKPMQADVLPSRRLDSMAGFSIGSHKDTRSVNIGDGIGGANIPPYLRSRFNYKTMDSLGGAEIPPAVQDYILHYFRTMDSLGGAEIPPAVRDYLSKFGYRSVDGNIERTLDSLGGGNILLKGKRLDSLSGMSLGTQKRTFDEIDRTGFDGFHKRNFDEIDRAGFDGFVKRDTRSAETS